MAEQKESDVEMLRRIAQNDYMIDTKYLPDGHRLLELADRLERAAHGDTSAANREPADEKNG